ncbi:MAG TPA: AMP-binding protein [Methanoregulaceae archaeon]|jgi:acetyl-CoA synthetase|nr:AMP-binding protein [Methanolinea sp.]MDD3092051.1 AMP-binding protein [Methanoregulaceae archaeon]HOP66962.1 AMP-binding protein [Methanoregulaceae archaeon]HPJ74204.1 AMP-binding protein [Methanoregulaceae archaeon]HPQ75695.1 AMP-binding protein [Methanoregulaceae archaeon]
MEDTTIDFDSYDEMCRDFQVHVPKYFNFGFDVIDRWAEIDRNKLAMIWVNQAGLEKKFSFRDMKNLSNQAANILLKYGIQKGDRVMLMLPRIPEWWIFTVALIKLGAVVCPCPTMLTPKDIDYRLNVGKFKMIITNRENSAKVDEVVDGCPSLTCRFLVDGERPGWVSFPDELLYPAPVSHRSVSMPVGKTLATDPMLIYFTSGTTGEPKMVLHNNGYPLGHLVTAGLWQTVGKNDVHFTYSDTGWAKCAWGKIFGQWIRGACLFIYDVKGRFKATELLPLLEKYEISTFCVPPTIYRMLILADLEKFDLRELRHCVSAGEPLNPEVIRVWEEGTGLTIHEGYGQTETVCCIGTFKGMKNRPGSMGKPAPGWHIELHDDDGNIVGLHEEGKIAVGLNPRPPGLFVEYLDNAAANTESFRNGFYYTGDKAFRDEDGYYWFVGRDDDIIKSSGYRIGPFEVESALLEHPAVQESAVVGSPDLIRGTIVKAFIVLKPGYDPSERLVKDIQNHVRSTTAPYKYPRAVEFVKDLPKTLSGKIKRNELRANEFARFSKD